MTDTILVLNTGSSSVKFALYDADSLDMRVRGCIDDAGAVATLSVEGRDADVLRAYDDLQTGGHAVQITWLLNAIQAQLPQLKLVGAGHRVVHGGQNHAAPVLITDAVVRDLESLVPLAPAHQPHNLAGIAAVAKAWPDLPQIACFDTAFHRTQPRLARLFPLPRALSDEGVERYGFHGLSYQHVAETLPALAGAKAEGRVIVAHLGNGASLCAMKERKSIATTMGMTALDGLMMGTRSGAIDPGLILHLIEQRGMSPAQVSDMLGRKSGLLGVSGISGDVRTLEASDDPRAAEALELFAYRAVRECGSLIAALGGLDMLVFTGGIGEHSARMRRQIGAGLAWAGIELDDSANNSHTATISSASSPVSALVIAANEESPIARAVRAMVLAGTAAS